ncbi:hypothetical protein [Pseudomonas azotoformans]|uniref:hypothetical protein n=2 Tax=Pseudomonas azotoformans TaxID=47878 RepID=UPI001179F981|nr:hypothetical protein [Pseudomonas azotoformans]
MAMLLEERQVAWHQGHKPVQCGHCGVIAISSSNRPVLNSRFNDARSFFSCSDWAVFTVIQQMDALKAQEKTRFEEIRRNT